MRVAVSYINTAVPFSDRIDATFEGGGRGDACSPITP